MTPQKYALELKRKLGPDAHALAKRMKKMSAPENWKELPVGVVFFEYLGPKQWRLRERELRKTYNFWSHVEGILGSKK